jgi:hypothetical protein
MRARQQLEAPRGTPKNLHGKQNFVSIKYLDEKILIKVKPWSSGLLQHRVAMR